MAEIGVRACVGPLERGVRIDVPALRLVTLAAHGLNFYHTIELCARITIS